MKDDILKVIKAVKEGHLPREPLLELFYEAILSQPNGEQTLKETVTYEQLLAMTLKTRPLNVSDDVAESLAQLLWEIIPEENKATSITIQ